MLIPTCRRRIVQTATRKNIYPKMKSETSTHNSIPTPPLGQNCSIPSQPLAKYGIPIPTPEFLSSLGSSAWIQIASFVCVFVLLMVHAQTYDPARDSKGWFWLRVYCFMAVLMTYSAQGASKIQAWARSEGCNVNE